MAIAPNEGQQGIHLLLCLRICVFQIIIIV